MRSGKKPNNNVVGEKFSYPFDDDKWTKVCTIPKHVALEWINIYLSNVETLINKFAVVVCVEYYGFKQHITAIYNKDRVYRLIKKIEEEEV